MYKEEVLVADPETAIELSDFQIERNKPIPNIIHGYIQAEISFQLKVKYDDKYLVVSELSLDTQPSSTPDICICEEQSLDVWAVEPKAKTPPLTTVEIISPSQSVHELMQKARELYFPVGVKSAWLVVPE